MVFEDCFTFLSTFHSPNIVMFVLIACTQVAQKTVSTMLGGKTVPDTELYLARTAGFGSLVDVVNRLNI